MTPLDLNIDDLIDAWGQTVGLTIDRVVQSYLSRYDDPVELTLIIFTNGKWLIQHDQSYYTTLSGLISPHDISRYPNDIKTIEL